MNKQEMRYHAKLRERSERIRACETTIGITEKIIGGMEWAVKLGGQTLALLRDKIGRNLYCVYCQAEEALRTHLGGTSNFRRYMRYSEELARQQNMVLSTWGWRELTPGT